MAFSIFSPLSLNNMRKSFFATCLGLLIAAVATAQYPASFAFNHLDTPNHRNFEAFNTADLWDEAAYYEEQGQEFMGKIRNDGFNFFDLATHDQLPNGKHIWRLRFHSDDALALTVYFNDFHLPVGSELYLYNPDGSYFEGPLDHTENDDHGLFVTNDIYGEDIVLEYVHPQHVIGEPRLMVRGVGYLFRHVSRPEPTTRGSDACQVDTACPEGEPWECQIDAVVRLRITAGNGVFVCSGVMVNTTAKDCREYMLSALHCVTNVSTSDYAMLQVRFDYQRSMCGGGTGPSSRNRTGVIKLADSNDNGGNSGSDFVLFEIENSIPTQWNPYFAGWDATGVGSNFGAGIHHPSGDWKKISIYTTNLTSQWWGAPGSHWGVVWTPTESGHGVTEGGSSGSPIFNANGLIIGTLTGGASACDPGGAGNGTGPNQADFYGKMSHHWNNNPNSASQKLRVWLDPLGSGPDATDAPTNVLHGSYRNEDNALPCGIAGACDAVNVEETELTASTVVISPNPARDEVFLRIKDRTDIEFLHIYDGQGRMVRTINVFTAVSRIDISELPSGMYFFTVETKSGETNTQRVVKVL